MTKNKFSVVLSIFQFYEVCSRSIASYFNMLAHKVRAYVGGIAVELEPSHKYSSIFCCHVTDGNGRAVWQNDVWHKSEYKAKMYWVPLCWINGTRSLMFTEHLWRSNCGWEHNEATGAAFQRWWQWVRFLLAWNAGSLSSLPKMDN